MSYFKAFLLSAVVLSLLSSPGLRAETLENSEHLDVLKVDHVGASDQEEPYEEEEETPVEESREQSDQQTEQYVEDESSENLVVQEEAKSEEPKLKAPEISKRKARKEEASLKKLVHELEYGSLQNSIRLLQKMVQRYPYDPDYKNLLDAARNLNKADIWYQYQLRLQHPLNSPRPQKVQKLIKMPRREKPINSLKQSSWFLLIKHRQAVQ